MSVESSAETSPVHFLPYGAYVASCGRIEDQRHPEIWNDERKYVTCADCQGQMTDLGDLPPAVTTSPAKPTQEGA